MWPPEEKTRCLEFARDARKALDLVIQQIEAGAEPFDLHPALGRAVEALQNADQVAAESATDAELATLSRMKAPRP